MSTPIRVAMRDFIKGETSGGFMLIGAAVLAMLIVNFGGEAMYRALWNAPVTVTANGVGIDKPLLLWVNDGLMAVFFFLIGLEVKREVLDGQLSSWSQASLPIYAAIGGMAVPAAVFLFVNAGEAENIRGWAIPAATDIAFALGILALLGKRAPVQLKVLLLAVAIIDDIGAIAIIALFYTENLSLMALGGAAAVLAALFAVNRSGVTRVAVYVLLGTIMWIFVLKSGVHATLAGVATAMFVPLKGASGEEGNETAPSPLITLEHALHPYVAFLILPVFAFANAGVSLAGFGPAALMQPLPLGIAAGLFFGKQIGVFGAIVIATALGAAKRPEGTTMLQLYGLACLTGIGFTMSLFIGTLAFPGFEQLEQVKIGVLAGSLASGLLGYLLIRFAIGGKSASDHAVA
ncbi:Na+/H+ antiporter NhaA [Altererythrobacter sp. ZODW24]|uniref:Na+/H+ antiporter NhaA n=1 Tax=Altererythrobacter sp. ZODW24 TaxID=2185142 RepID=UPI000DF741BA|nr:Na+/H+ antiporter NhaA [Altererythrobacter sp. ZODW24]